MTVLGEELKEKYDGCRFIIEEYPQILSLGYYYVVKDNCDEMISIMCDTDYTEAEEYCIFLNKLYDMLDKDPSNIRLQQQIININKASITTIHSFCLDIIRNYYYEIDIDPNFKVANEIDNQLMKYEILDEIYEVD